MCIAPRRGATLLLAPFPGALLLLLSPGGLRSASTTGYYLTAFQADPPKTKYDSVIVDSIPKEGSLFEFVILSPGPCRDERDLIVDQHDGSNRQ